MPTNANTATKNRAVNKPIPSPAILQGANMTSENTIPSGGMHNSKSSRQSDGESSKSRSGLQWRMHRYKNRGGTKRNTKYCISYHPFPQSPGKQEEIQLSNNPFKAKTVLASMRPTVRRLSLVPLHAAHIQTKKSRMALVKFTGSPVKITI